MPTPLNSPADLLFEYSKLSGDWRVRWLEGMHLHTGVVLGFIVDVHKDLKAVVKPDKNSGLMLSLLSLSEMQMLNGGPLPSLRDLEDVK